MCALRYLGCLLNTNIVASFVLYAVTRVDLPQVFFLYIKLLKFPLKKPLEGTLLQVLLHRIPSVQCTLLRRCCVMCLHYAVRVLYVYTLYACVCGCMYACVCVCVSVNKWHSRIRSVLIELPLSTTARQLFPVSLRPSSSADPA